jgi:hypothetical protein
MEDILNKLNKNKQEIVFVALLITSIKLLVLMIQSIFVSKRS